MSSRETQVHRTLLHIFEIYAYIAVINKIRWLNAHVGDPKPGICVAGLH